MIIGRKEADLGKFLEDALLEMGLREAPGFVDRSILRRYGSRGEAEGRQ